VKATGSGVSRKVVALWPSPDTGVRGVVLYATAPPEAPSRPFLPPIPMSRNHDRYGQHVYGTVHKRERRRWAPKVRAGGVCCWRCGDPILPGAVWDLGHVDDAGRDRGFPTRAPEHRACNRATVTHLKQRLAAAESPPPTASREW
jgi:hypothetical protein